MGQVPPVDKERNKALINDYKAGIYRPFELANKYGISSTRIYQILEHYKVRLFKVRKGKDNVGKES